MGFEIGKVTRLRLGYVGEDVARKIEIDVSSWLDKWPDALIHMTVKRPSEDDLYIPATDIKNGMLVWEILQSDVAIGGVGLAQVRALDRASGACYMSRVVETTIDNSMDGATDENAPDKSAGWVNQVLEAAAAVEDREEELTALVGEAKDSIATANSAAANADASADEATAAAGEAHDAADRADAAEKAAVEATEAAGRATTGANDATTAAGEAAKKATDAASAAVASANKADAATDAANNAAAGATDAAKTAQTAAAAANAGAAAATEAKNAANRAASTAENAGIAAQNAAQRAENAAEKAESTGGLPENSLPYQMLVSDGADATYWFTRLAFDYPAKKILPKTTLAYNSGTHGYLFFTDALSKVVIGKAYMVTIYNKYRYVGIARKGVYGGMPCVGFGNPYIFPLAPGDAPPQESLYEQSLSFAVIFPPAPSEDGTANGIFALMPGAPTESITVSIHLCDQKKLDARFLPDDIGGGLPEGGEPYKQLVTDGEGNAVWEDRLAYEEKGVVVRKEILPETELLGNDDNGDGVNDMFILAQPLNEPLVTGEMYTVIYNGAAYDSVVTELEGMPALGNSDLAAGTGDTGEPFVFLATTDADTNAAGIYGAVMPVDGANSVTLAISQIAEGDVVHTIQPKFLPDYLYGSDTTPLVCLEETTLTYNNGGNNTYISQMFANPIVAGQIYTVNWNGVDYVCEAAENTDYYVSLGEEGKTPFIVNYAKTPGPLDETTMVYGAVETFEDLESVTLSITRTEKIKKVPRKFLDVKDALIVKIDTHDVPDCTYAEILEAYNADRPIFCCWQPNMLANYLWAPLAQYSSTDADHFVFYVRNENNERNKIVITENDECTVERFYETQYATYVTSPNGTRYQITVSDDGVLSATKA